MTETKRPRGRPRKVAPAQPHVAYELPELPSVFVETVERFKRDHPDEWEAIRLCPTQHGIEIMAERLK